MCPLLERFELTPGSDRSSGLYTGSRYSVMQWLLSRLDESVVNRLINTVILDLTKKIKKKKKMFFIHWIFVKISCPS